MSHSVKKITYELISCCVGKAVWKLRKKVVRNMAWDDHKLALVTVSRKVFETKNVEGILKNRYGMGTIQVLPWQGLLLT